MFGLSWLGVLSLISLLLELPLSRTSSSLAGKLSLLSKTKGEKESKQKREGESLNPNRANSTSRISNFPKAQETKGYLET